MCKMKIAKILTDEGIVHKSHPYLRSYWRLVAIGKGRGNETLARKELMNLDGKPLSKC